MKNFERVLGRLDSEGEKLRLQSLTAPAQAFLTARLFLQSDSKKFLIVADDAADAEKLATDIRFFLGGRGDKVFHLPQWETLPYEPLSPHPDISAERSLALYGITKCETGFVCVTSAGALMQSCPAPDALEKSFVKLKVGDIRERDELAACFMETGYEFTDPVTEPGFFAFRGGLLDIFPPGRRLPYRIEFFGDELESIRSFDPETQRSMKRENEIVIPPMRETHYRGIDVNELLKRFDEFAGNASDSLTDARRKFENREFFDSMELYQPLFLQERKTLFDYFRNEPKIIASEPERIEERLERLKQQAHEGYEEALARNEHYPEPEQLYLDSGEMKERLGGSARLEFTELATRDESDDCITIKTAEPPRLHGAFSRCIYDCRERLKKSASSLIVMRSKDAALRIQKLFAEEDAGIKIVSPDETARLTAEGFDNGDEPSVMAAVGELTGGFATKGFAVTTEDEIFGHHVTPRRRAKRRAPAFETDFADVKPLDYVVHRDHGIGVYHGTKNVSVGGAHEEYIELEYAENQRLFMSISSIHLLEKYSGAGAPRPPLDRMGGKSWQKTRAKVKKGILKMAKELLEVWAKRTQSSGFGFAREGHYHREFTDSFEFTETPDQAQAIDDVAKDMESPRAMDRLVCGDVGYGKTEVALRAAFKAAMDGKQTALLVPTTLLASQHYETFKLRMDRFALKVEMLSRTAKRVKQKEILQDLERGKVDVVIGTHRLLQKDVKFSDLGLVIIDEEHRFGVRHKEKLKKLRESVDILALSATPIPRTLYMSLSGIRDISVINTPPPKRLSIKTLIRGFDDHAITEAITRELARGGQIFFLHNNVRSIGSMQSCLAKLVPQARSAIAHGQMSGDRLEKTMDMFIDKKIDMLVCSTIIESGLDIPNANTIIINRADRFGLSQLYQLRGRVGRDRHRAYAYLLVPKVLSKTARLRLKAVEELSELGSGYKLAARDLEIRGSGNLLGAQQSGNITAVGFETYSRMLAEAVDELKGGAVKPKVETELKLDFVGRLEEEYIPVLEQRMNFYNRLYRAADDDEITQIAEELKDRYGELPEKAGNVVHGVRLRLAGSSLGIKKVELFGNRLSLYFIEGSEQLIPVTHRASELFVDRVRLTGSGTLNIDLSKIPTDERAQTAVDFLITCTAAKDEGRAKARDSH